MRIDKAFFFKEIRNQKLFTSLTQLQVDSMDAVLNQWETSCYTDLRWLSYIYATIFHETARTMRPIEEYGKGKGRPYGNKIKRSGIHYTVPDKIYYGRGFVQLTWYENYELMGRLLHVDLLNHPELALDLKVATNILFEGMTKGSSSFGDFTGKSLEMYIHDGVCDYVNCRKIINGLDKASLIAGYAMKFEKCLKIAL